MPTPVLRRDGPDAGRESNLRRAQIAAPVPPSAAFAAHCCARQLGLRTSEMLRLALAEFIQSRADMLTPVEQHAVELLRAASDPAFRQGRPKQKQPATSASLPVVITAAKQPEAK